MSPSSGEYFLRSSQIQRRRSSIGLRRQRPQICGGRHKNRKRYCYSFSEHGNNNPAFVISHRCVTEYLQNITDINLICSISYKLIINQSLFYQGSFEKNIYFFSLYVISHHQNVYYLLYFSFIKIFYMQSRKKHCYE